LPNARRVGHGSPAPCASGPPFGCGRRARRDASSGARSPRAPRRRVGAASRAHPATVVAKSAPWGACSHWHALSVEWRGGIGIRWPGTSGALGGERSVEPALHGAGRRRDAVFPGAPSVAAAPPWTSRGRRQMASGCAGTSGMRAGLAAGGYRLPVATRDASAS
jgi:hypothetical protein